MGKYDGIVLVLAGIFALRYVLPLWTEALSYSARAYAVNESAPPKRLVLNCDAPFPWLPFQRKLFLDPLPPEDRAEAKLRHEQQFRTSCRAAAKELNESEVKQRINPNPTPLTTVPQVEWRPGTDPLHPEGRYSPTISPSLIYPQTVNPNPAYKFPNTTSQLRQPGGLFADEPYAAAYARAYATKTFPWPPTPKAQNTKGGAVPR